MRILLTTSLIFVLGTACEPEDEKSNEVIEAVASAGTQSESSPPGAPDLDLTATFANNMWLSTSDSVSVDIDCQGWEEFGYSINEEASEPISWQACATGSLEINLDDGRNFVKVWFSSAGVIKNIDLGVRLKSREIKLTSPSPATSGGFGGFASGMTQILDNGNIVIVEANASNGISNQGAVHLFDGRTATRISSVYGDHADDFLGLRGIASTGVYPLPNGNYVIVSSNDNTDTLSDAGTIRLVDGTNGAEISRITGQADNVRLGSAGITVLPNSNYVVRDSNFDSGATADVGAAILVNGIDGSEISRIIGDQALDKLGSSGIAVLSSGNYVIQSKEDDNAALVDAGSVILVDGSTGLEISRIVGDQASDQIGSGQVMELSSGDYVIVSPLDNTATLSDAGSVILVNGATGVEKARISGDQNSDTIGSTEVVELATAHFVIISQNDNTATLSDAGSAILVNGETGAQIAKIQGDQNSDRIGSSRMTAFSSGHFAVRSRYDANGGLASAGSVMYINGLTGAVISTIRGNQANDEIGKNGVFELPNGHFVIANRVDNTASLADAGSVILINGETGSEISRITGNQAADQVSRSGVTVLTNGNYAIASRDDNSSTLSGVGSVILANGETGAEVSRIEGEREYDHIGYTEVTELTNGNYVIVSEFANTATVSDAGSVILVNGTTGAEISRVEGNQNNDEIGRDGVVALANGNFAIRSGEDSSASVGRAGSLTMVNGETGEVIYKAEGTSSTANISEHFTLAHPLYNYLIVSGVDEDVDGVAGAGVIRLISFD